MGIPDAGPGSPQRIDALIVALPIAVQRRADRAECDFGSGQLVAGIAVAAARRLGLVAELQAHAGLRNLLAPLPIAEPMPIVGVPNALERFALQVTLQIGRQQVGLRAA